MNAIVESIWLVPKDVPIGNIDFTCVGVSCCLLGQ